MVEDQRKRYTEDDVMHPLTWGDTNICICIEDLKEAGLQMGTIIIISEYW